MILLLLFLAGCASEPLAGNAGKTSSTTSSTNVPGPTYAQTRLECVHEYDAAGRTVFAGYCVPR